MELGTIIGGIILIALAILAIVQPFTGKNSVSTLNASTQKQHDELLTSYERVLATIRDLDEDFNTGKLAAHSYQQEREYWTEQGISLLQVLEPETKEQDVLPVKPLKSDKAERQLDDAVEKAIADYRKAKA